MPAARRCNDRVRGFARIVGQHQQIEITLRNLPFTGNARVNPSQESCPICAPEQNDGKVVDFPRLHEGQRFKKFVECAEPARENDEGLGVFEKAVEGIEVGRPPVAVSYLYLLPVEINLLLHKFLRDAHGIVFGH